MVATLTCIFLTHTHIHTHTHTYTHRQLSEYHNSLQSGQTDVEELRAECARRISGSEKKLQTVIKVSVGISPSFPVGRLILEGYNLLFCEFISLKILATCKLYSSVDSAGHRSLPLFGTSCRPSKATRSLMPTVKAGIIECVHRLDAYFY